MAITEKQQRFIEEIAKNVQKYAYVYGILVHSPIIAQAILESGYGESKLAAKYHNYFGLKCGSKWTGKSVNLTTQEESRIRRNTCRQSKTTDMPHRAHTSKATTN